MSLSSEPGNSQGQRGGAGASESDVIAVDGGILFVPKGQSKKGFWQTNTIAKGAALSAGVYAGSRLLGLGHFGAATVAVSASLATSAAVALHQTFST